MAQTSVLSSIQRSGTFPITQNISAPNNCGTLALILNQNWTEQMIHELPTINVAVYVDTDIKLLSIDIDMTTVCSDKTDLEPIKPYSIPLFDLPESFDFVVTPIFDNNALASHNAQIDSGDVNVFNTSGTGIVDTDIEDYSSEYWTTETTTFDIDMVFDDTNISSSGGGGGSGQTITVDTQVIQGSTNPVQNGAIYDFVNSSVSTSTAYFIGTFNSLAELEAYSGTVTNNDYAFVISTDSNGNTVYNRYKYNIETETWNFEYSLNNSSFTAAEWETIQSGLTANDRTNYNNHLTNTNNPHSVTKAQVGLGNVDNTSDANKPISTATQTALNGKQDNLTFDGTYDASTNKAATVSTVTNAINNLDVSSVGGSGKYISAISETNGKISPTVETMDTTPTSGSEKAVTSGAVYTALSSKQDALSQSQLAAVNSGITAEKLTADEAALAEVVNAGAKNRFDPASAWDSKTAYGVTITRNGDTYSIVSGTTQSGDNNFINMGYQANTNLISAGDWVLSFDTQQQNVRFQVCWNGALQANASFGNNCFFTVPENTTDSWFRIILRGSTNMAGTSFKIMLCPRILWDVSHQFEPYALPNPTLTPAVIKAVDEGEKNKLQLFQLGSSNANVGNPCTSQGVEYEIQSDGTITAYRKSSASFSAYIFLYKNGAAQNVSEFFDGNHIWSGNPSQYPDGGVSVWYKIGSGSNITLPNGALLPNANGETVQIGIQISTALSPTQSNPIVFRPMICTAADWAISQAYQPYRPSWQEMVDNNKIIDISSKITAESGYTVKSTTHLYYQNKQVFGTIAIAINSGSYPSSLATIAKLPVEYAPARQYLGSCGFSTDQWAITDIGYAFIQAANASSTAQRGQISVKSPTANLTHMILNVCYPIQIDGVLAAT